VIRGLADMDAQMSYPALQKQVELIKY